MLLAGVATVWLLFVLVRQIAGTRTALAPTAQVAAYATFVMTACMDWGRSRCAAAWKPGADYLAVKAIL